MELFLRSWIFYQIISHTAMYEANDESRTNEDDYALRLSSTEKSIKVNYKGEADNNWRSDEDEFGLGRPTQKSPKIKEEDKQYEAEKKLGDMADLFGTNQHYSYPELYKDLGRRFVLQYPYKELANINEGEGEEINFSNNADVKDSMDKNVIDTHLIPVKAPPELVLAVAAKAALLEAAIPRNPLREKLIDKEILRSGNYWNNVWREDVDPNILRAQNVKVVQPVKVKVLPDSKLYKLVSELKKISPRLVYVMNKA